MIIENWQLYLGMMITGLFTGLGSALGTYLANKHIIESINKLNKLINNKQQDGERNTQEPK